MRVILFKNGAVINNTINVNLVPSNVTETYISIPGYVAGSLTLITDLEYDYTVDGDIIHIRIYVPQDYGATGETSIVISYASTSIYGTIYYIYDADTGVSSRLISITNNSGTDFEAEIGVAEQNDIHAVHELSYAIVGEDLVREGTHLYQVPTDIITHLSFYVDIPDERVWTFIDMEVNGGEPLPGEIVVSHPVFRIETEVEGGLTITDEPQDAVILERGGTSPILDVAIPAVVHFPGVSSLSIVGADGIIPSESEDDGVYATIPIGIYSLSNIVYL